MDAYIQSRINNLRLLGFSVKKHVTGVYVAINENNGMHNVYNGEFKPIIVSKETVRILDEVIEVRTENEIEVYSFNGKLLCTTEAKNYIHISEGKIYVYKDKRYEELVEIITKEGSHIGNIPNEELIMCNISNKGNVYFLSLYGSLYCDGEILTNYATYGIGYFTEKYYTKLRHNKYKVYELDNHKCINRHGWSEICIRNDNIIFTSTRKHKKFYLYKNGHMQILNTNLHKKGIVEVKFIIDEPIILLLATYKNGMCTILDSIGNTLNDKIYNYVGIINSKYILGCNEKGKDEILDLNCNIVIEADNIEIDEYEIIVTNKGQINIFGYDKL